MLLNNCIVLYCILLSLLNVEVWLNCMNEDKQHPHVSFLVKTLLISPGNY